MQLPQSWMTSLCESEDNIWSNRNKPGFTAPPIAIPLLEMGFTLKHILKAISETKSSGEFTSHTVNMLATWMLEHPSLDISEDEGTSDRYNLFRFLDRSQNLLRQQSLDNTEIKCGHRRGIGLRGTICSELRNTIGQVDRVLQDTIRERQHVRGEGHHLLRNFSCEGSSSDINLLESNDTDQREQISSSYIGIENNICPYCQHTTPYLDSHMTIYHPGCGTLWGPGVCGYCTDGFYILCYKCKNKHFQKGYGNSSLHIRAPDIIYDEDNTTEADVQSLKFNMPNYEDIDKIKYYLGINDKDIKVTSLNLEKFDPLGMDAVPSVVNECGNINTTEKR